MCGFVIGTQDYQLIENKLAIVKPATLYIIIMKMIDTVVLNCHHHAFVIITAVAAAAVGSINTYSFEILANSATHGLEKLPKTFTIVLD